MVNPARRYGDQTAAQVHLGTSARINTGTSVNPQGPQKPRPEPYPPLTPPVIVPTDLSASALAYNQILLRYSEVTVDVDGYEVEVSEDAGASWYRWRRPPTAAKGILWTGRDYTGKCLMGGFKASTTYTFRMRSYAWQDGQRTFGQWSNLAQTTTPEYVTATGGGIVVWNVIDQSSWRTARDGAEYGDIINIFGGIRIDGNPDAFMPQPGGTGEGFVTIRTPNLQHEPYVRANPADAPIMGGFKPSFTNTPAFMSSLGVDRILFESIVFENTDQQVTNSLLALGYDGENFGQGPVAQNKNEVPAFYECHGCLFLNTPPRRQSDMVWARCHYFVMQDCYLSAGCYPNSEPHSFGHDIGSVKWVANNYIATAGGIHHISGGQVTAYADTIHNCVFYRNYFYRDPAWATEPYPNKNIFEMKNGSDFELVDCKGVNSWAGQPSAIVLTPVTYTPNTEVIEKVYIGYSWFADFAQGALVVRSAEDKVVSTTHVASPTNNILCEHLVLDNIQDNSWPVGKVGIGDAFGLAGSSGYDSTYSQPGDRFTYRHVTAINVNEDVGFRQRGSLYDGPSQLWENVTIEDNLFFGGVYGVFLRAGGSHGVPGLNDALGSEWTWQYNGQFTTEAEDQSLNTVTHYPPADCPGCILDPVLRSIADIQFEDYAAGDLRLKPTSPCYQQASDGTDMGADVAAVIARIQHVETGDWKAVTPPANDFSNDATCKCLWRFEPTEIVADSQGTNTLTNNGSTANQTDFREGLSSADFDEGASQYMEVADVDLDADFPLKSGALNPSFSLCFWLILDNVTLVEYHGIVAKHQAGLVSMSLNSHLRKTRLALGHSNGVAFEFFDHASDLVAGTWYHIGVTYDGPSKAVRIRIWDDNADALLGSDLTASAVNDLSTTAADLFLMRRTSSADDLDGRLDEMVWFNRAISVAEIDQIRQKLFGS